MEVKFREILLIYIYAYHKYNMQTELLFLSVLFANFFMICEFIDLYQMRSALSDTSFSINDNNIHNRNNNDNSLDQILMRLEMPSDDDDSFYNPPNFDN